MPIDDDLEAVVRWRGRRDAVVELAVDHVVPDHVVPDIAGLTVSVERRSPGGLTEMLSATVSAVSPTDGSRE